MATIKQPRAAWEAGVKAGLAGDRKPYLRAKMRDDVLAFLSGRIEGQAWRQGYGSKHPLTGEPRAKAARNER